MPSPAPSVVTDQKHGRQRPREQPQSTNGSNSIGESLSSMTPPCPTQSKEQSQQRHRKTVSNHSTRCISLNQRARPDKVSEKQRHQRSATGPSEESPDDDRHRPREVPSALLLLLYHPCHVRIRAAAGLAASIQTAAAQACGAHSTGHPTVQTTTHFSHIDYNMQA